MNNFKIIISYSDENDKNIVYLISRRIKKVLKPHFKNIHLEILIIKCHRKKNNTIFIQPIHGKMNSILAKCYRDLLKTYMKATKYEYFANKFMNRIKIGSIEIKV